MATSGIIRSDNYLKYFHYKAHIIQRDSLSEKIVTTTMETSNNPSA